MEGVKYSSTNSSAYRSDQINAPASLTLANDPVPHRIECWLGPQSRSERRGEEKSLLILPGIKNEYRLCYSGPSAPLIRN